jgi:hypothetical protein
MALQNPQIDYSVKTVDVLPKYKFSKLYQQTGGSALTIAATSQESVFELPTRCMNLSRSSLSFNIVIPPAVDPADGVTAVAKYNRLFLAAVAPIRQIQLYTRGGVFLCDINNFDRYSNIVGLAETTKEDAVIDNPDRTAGFASNTRQYLTVTGNKENYLYDDTVVLSNNPYEPKYAATGTAAPGASTYNIHIPFTAVSNTVLSIDKDFYFNEVVLLKITWNDKNSWGVDTTNATQMDGGAAAFSDIALSDLRLYLALETDMMICAGIIETVRTTGMTTIIPYAYQFKTSLAQNENHNVSIRLNRAHGRNLKKIYHTMYTSNGTLNSRYYHSNQDKLNYLSYNTSVDNVRRQEFDVVTKYDEDYLIIKDILKGTIMEDINTFRNNWFILDKFDDELHSNKSDTADTGLSLDVEHKWDLTALTLDSAWDHYTFAIVTRMLAITPEGIFIQ